MSSTEEFERLFSRLDDMKKRAGRGELGVSAFLSPREEHYAVGYLSRNGTDLFSYGGYPDAERKRIYVLPEYMEDVRSVEELCEYGEDSGIIVLHVTGSGFCNLTHRDFMGALLGLGIERSVIGDIIVINGHEALVMCDVRIKDFLLSEWNSVGRDRVKCEVVDLPSDFTPVRNYAQVNDTLASARLDCVIAALCNLSRADAKSAIESGICEIDYECENHPDREVIPPVLISVRGYGKFRVCSIGGQTKKGRYKLTAQKFL